MPYSTGCSTALSNFEAGQNYKDVSGARRHMQSLAGTAGARSLLVGAADRLQEGRRVSVAGSCHQAGSLCSPALATLAGSCLCLVRRSRCRRLILIACLLRAALNTLPASFPPL